MFRVDPFLFSTDLLTVLQHKLPVKPCSLAVILILMVFHDKYY